VLRFYWSLVCRAPVLLWQAADWVGRIGVLVLVAGPPILAFIAERAGTAMIPDWVTVGWPTVVLAVLFVYGMLRANHERFLQFASELEKREQSESELKQQLSDLQNRRAAITIHDPKPVKDTLGEGFVVEVTNSGARVEEVTAWLTLTSIVSKELSRRVRLRWDQDASQVPLNRGESREIDGIRYEAYQGGAWISVLTTQSPPPKFSAASGDAYELVLRVQLDEESITTFFVLDVRDEGITLIKRDPEP
jgi:hypothetical protein